MAKSYFFKGKAMWAKVNKPTANYAGDGFQWEIGVILDDASQKLFDQSGLSLRPNKKDGSIRFKRPTAKMIKGNTVTFDPPRVVDAEGKAFVKDIGNESIVVVEVDVYPTMRGTGHQLEAVQVLDLVEYEGSKREVIAADDVVPF